MSAGHRAHSREGPRTLRTSVRWNVSERALVRAAAARHDLKPGAFASQASVTVAALVVNGVDVDLEELQRLVAVHSDLKGLAEVVSGLRRQLAAIGAELNRSAGAGSPNEGVAELRSVLRTLDRCLPALYRVARPR